MRLLAVDPGGRYTGWAVFGGGKLEMRGTSEGLVSAFSLLDELVPTVDEVAMEKYVLFTTSPAGVDTIKVMGVAEYLCWQFKVPYYQYTAKQIKPKVTDKVLRENGLWFPGKGHDRDAARVAVFHLSKTHREYELGRVIV